jgi:hypothetical protein
MKMAGTRGRQLVTLELIGAGVRAKPECLRRAWEGYISDH